MRATVSIGALALLAALAATTGCSDVPGLKQAYYEVRGAQAELRFNTILPAAAVRRAGGVTFAPAHTSLGSKLCPPAVLRALDDAASKAAGELRGVLTGAGSPLTIETEVYYYQEKGLMSGGQLIARVRIDSGETAGDALVVAETNSFRAGGEADLAKAAVDKIAAYLKEQVAQAR